MPRLRSNTTGVVVNVSDEKAERLTGFTLIDEKPAPKRRTAKKSDNDE
jgi:hypothetical protein